MFKWDPDSGDPVIRSADRPDGLTADAIRDRIIEDDPQPPRLVPVDQLRKKIADVQSVDQRLSMAVQRVYGVDPQVRGISFERNLPDDMYSEEFPSKVPRVVPLLVAEKRGCDLVSEGVDFLLGGSFFRAASERDANQWDCFSRTDVMGFRTDSTFSNSKNRHRYLVHNCKGVLVIDKDMLSAVKPENAAEPASQFKRWACGRPMAARHGVSQFEHLRLLQVAVDDGPNGGPTQTFKVLVSASIDAQDEVGKPTKIRMRTLNESTFLEIMLQLLSCGANRYVRGQRGKVSYRDRFSGEVKTRPGPLVDVVDHDLGQICRDALMHPEVGRDKIARAERNIGEALRDLKALAGTLAEDCTYEIFRDKPEQPLRAERVEEARFSFMPPASILEELFLGMNRSLLPDAMRRFYDLGGAFATLPGLKSVKALFSRQAGATGSGENDLDEMMSVREALSTCYSFCHSANTWKTKSSFGIQVNSKFRVEQIGELLRCIYQFRRSGSKSTVHYYRFKMYDREYANWPEKLPEEIAALVQVMRSGAEPSDQEDKRSFFDFVRFVRNTVEHLEHNYTQEQHPWYGWFGPASVAATFLSKRAERDPEMMMEKGKAFPAAFLSCVLDAFPSFHKDIGDIRMFCDQWTSTKGKLGTDAIKRLELQDESGDSIIHRAVRQQSLSDIKQLLGSEHIKPDHVLWENVEGESAVDLAERNMLGEGDHPEISCTHAAREIYLALQDFVLRSPDREHHIRPRFTRLHDAIAEHNLSRCRYLLHRGVSPAWLRRDALNGMVFGVRELAAHFLEEASQPSGEGSDSETEGKSVDVGSSTKESGGGSTQDTSAAERMCAMRAICDLLGVDDEVREGLDSTLEFHDAASQDLCGVGVSDDEFSAEEASTAESVVGGSGKGVRRARARSGSSTRSRTGSVSSTRTRTNDDDVFSD